jgi:hypothetical protein
LTASATPAHKPPIEPEPECTLPAPVEAPEPTTPALLVDIMALAKKLAAHMDMLTVEVEALFTEAADACMADEVEAMFYDPYDRLRNVMGDASLTLPAEEDEG